MTLKQWQNTEQWFITNTICDLQFSITRRSFTYLQDRPVMFSVVPLHFWSQSQFLPSKHTSITETHQRVGCLINLLQYRRKETSFQAQQLVSTPWSWNWLNNKALGKLAGNAQWMLRNNHKALFKNCRKGKHHPFNYKWMCTRAPSDNTSKHQTTGDICSRWFSPRQVLVLHWSISVYFIKDNESFGLLFYIHDQHESSDTEMLSKPK